MDIFSYLALPKTNPGLKTLLSVGGEGKAGLFAGVMDSRESILTFAQNCRIYLHDRGFDGIDIDWEYPDKYKDKFTEFLKV